jgi:predicted nicotinamide N-methyase
LVVKYFDMEIIRVPVKTDVVANASNGNDDAQVYLDLECNWDVGIGGSLWTSGRLLVDYIHRNVDERMQLHNKTILELGSGTGLVGLAMALCSPKRVILTDLSSHIKSLSQNIDRNSRLIPKLTQVDAVVLDWTTITAASVREMLPIDLIVGTDIAYMPEFYTPLITTLSLLAQDKTRILIGLGRHDTSMQFFRLLVDAGFDYCKIHDEYIGDEYRGKDFGIIEIVRAK